MRGARCSGRSALETPRGALHDPGMRSLRWSLFVVVGVLTLATPLTAAAQNGPAGKNSWASLRLETASTYQLSGVQLASGVTFEWGMLQNKYFGVGTRVGFTRNNPAAPAFLIMGGPQAHIALGDVITLMPSLTTGLRLSQAGLGFAVLGALGAVARFDTFYAGAEFELPLFMQSPNVGLLANTFVWSVNVIGGFYF